MSDMNSPNPLKRNDRTTIDKLQLGDRFHLLSDKKQALWKKIIHERHPQEMNWAIKDGDRNPQPIKLSTVLVFLRAAPVAAR